MDKTRGHDVAAHLADIPFAVALGARLVDYSDTHCEIALPWREDLVGDPDTGVLHGGVVTAMLDNVSGIVAFKRDVDHNDEAVATLDMRIDYLAAATPGRELRFRAESHRRTRNVVFVRAVAFHDSVDAPIATANAAFMVGTPNTTLQGTQA